MAPPSARQGAWAKRTFPFLVYVSPPAVDMNEHPQADLPLAVSAAPGCLLGGVTGICLSVWQDV